MAEIAAVVLAAGAGSRYRDSGAQGPKQLASIHGRPMLQLAIDRVSQLPLKAVYTVLGYSWQSIADNICNTEVLINSNWQRGLGSSIALATTEITRRQPSCQGLLFVLADQPVLGSEQLTEILQLFNGHQPICASYKGSIGVPALFPQKMFSTLKGLSADFGAKAVLQSMRDSLITVPMPAAALDIDTVEDLQRLKAQQLVD
jgi:molybdenum cofactor cytidylyltransferase